MHPKFLRIDFSKVLQTSAATLMYSVDGSKTFVKFDNEVPSFLEGKTVHNHSEILEIISGTDWVQPK